MYPYIPLNLQMFAANDVVNATIGYVNANTGAVTQFSGRDDLSPQNKTFYDTVLLQNARERHYFAQFGMKQPLPANSGQTVEWRKFNTLPKAMTPLVEGVTPTGRKLGQTVLTQSIAQHGDYVELTDKIHMHTIDNVVVAATEELGAAAGNTQDALVRDELLTGGNVLYCDRVSGGVAYPVTHRWELTPECKLTPRMINRARTILAKANAPTINGKYVALIPSVVLEDLRQDPAWNEAHKYAAPEEIFNGEAGELHGVRFVETNTVRTFAPAPLFGSTSRYLTVSAYSGSATDSSATYGSPSAYRITVSQTLTADAAALVGRLVLIEQSAAIVGQMEIVGVTPASSYIYVKAVPTGVTPASSNYLLPGEGGKETYAGGVQVATYACMFFGKDAFAVIDPAGGAMETIVKPLGSAGSADPLNQRSTVGYKFETASKILYEERLLRVECSSSYAATDEDNA